MEKQKLQHATLVYVLAILGLPLCCCGGFGILPAAIGFHLAHTELKKYYENPDLYDNQDNIYTAKIIALVVLGINALYLIFTIYSLYTNWDLFMETYNKTMQQYS